MQQIISPLSFHSMINLNRSIPINCTKCSRKNYPKLLPKEITWPHRGYLFPSKEYLFPLEKYYFPCVKCPVWRRIIY